MQTGFLVINTEKTGNTPQEKKEDTGNLIVTKNVIGESQDLEKSFSFTVTLSDKTINGTYGEMKFENGVSTFSLKHGEKKAAHHLPKDISYQVEESGNEGYRVSCDNATGKIPDKDVVVVRFTNEAIPQNPPSRPDRHKPTPPPENETPKEKTPPDVPAPPKGNPPTTKNPTPISNIPSKQVHQPTPQTSRSDRTATNNLPSASNKTGSQRSAGSVHTSPLDHIPKTEDASCIEIWLMLALLSFLSLAAMIVMEKRKN